MEQRPTLRPTQEFGEAQDAGPTPMKALTLTVVSIALQITSSGLPSGQVGVPFQATLTASGGVTPYAWTVTSGQLPPGIALNSSTGKLEGTPTSAGQYTFTVQVQDSGAPSQSASQAFSVNVAAASALDQYGGDAKHACGGTMKDGRAIPGATGFFYLYKDTNLKHWMYCDPVGNRFWMTSVQVFDIGQAFGWTSKFGAGVRWQEPETRRLRSLGFNTIGEYGNIHTWPDDNSVLMPFIYSISPAHYEALGSQYSCMMKDIFANLPPAYSGYRGYRSRDIFDSNWTNVVQNWPTVASSQSTPYTNGSVGLDASPYLVGVTMDDSDWIGGFKIAWGAAVFTWEIGISAPYEQFENSYGYGSRVTSDPVMHTKQQWSTWLCGTRYANLAALNAAWGSAYSTCGSSAITAGSERIGTGDGVTTSFTHTLTHLPVDPASVGISVGGVLQGGDTPWFNVNQCSKTSGNGCIQAAIGNINGSNITYSTGVVTVTFSVAPANGVAITATYQYGGWPKAISGGTGLLDEDGTSSWWPANDTPPDPPVTTITTDMDIFFGQYTQQYFRTVHDWVKAKLPHHVLFGIDPFPTFGRRQMYLNSIPYLDAAMYFSAIQPSWAPEGYPPGLATANALYNTYNMPGYVYVIKASNPDSQFSAYSCPIQGSQCFNTQQARGVSYKSDVNALYTNYAGSDGYGYIVGIDYWQWQDNNSEKGNYGLVSLNDNFYNGIESCGKSVIDPRGFPTIPEPTTGCYGDFITPVKAANGIWLGP
jgi:hypothetical protein